MDRWREKNGEVFSIPKDNPTVPGCTISKSVFAGEENNLIYFSLAEDTSISAETYQNPKLLILNSGSMTVFAPEGDEQKMQAGDVTVMPAGTPVGMRTEEGAVYTELSLGKEQHMNKVLEAGKVMKLADLVPYQEGRIVNMDLINEDHLKFVIMAFDEGTGLTEHAAPGEALIFALEGDGVIGYEGESHPIHAGENFKFAKNGRHSVQAKGRFKMALLLTLE